MGSRGVHNGLVGGDVRMGKSNLLHVLITQLALKYPPRSLSCTCWTSRRWSSTRT